MMETIKDWFYIFFYFGGDVLLYAVLGILLVWAVWKRTSKKVYRWLAVSLVVLVPTWDVVLSAILFYASCPFVPKAAIYETAETDGIYYEGGYSDSIILYHSEKLEANPKVYVPSIYNDLAKGYQYFESLVTSVQAEIPGNRVAISPPAVYRCVPMHQDPKVPAETIIQCSPVDRIKSNYLVRLEDYRFLLVKIGCLSIYNRSTGTVMAEYRHVVFDTYRGWAWAPIPFFNWLDFEWSVVKHDGAHCPQKLRHRDFQYDVLKIKK